MLAAIATSQDPANPLRGLELRDIPFSPRPGWETVAVRASSINMHDLWTLRGVGHPPDRLPIVLGCDAVGIDGKGREVIVYPVIADPDAGAGDETLDPNRVLLTERHDGAFAEFMQIPARNLIPKPSWLTFEEAACLPVAWGTAYRMLYTHARIRPGDRVLVQGCGGGVATAAISLAVAGGAVVTATSRSHAKRMLARQLGAAHTLEVGEKVPEKADVVIETVGRATWSHSMRSLRPGGAIVIAGATSGMDPAADLGRLFFQQQRILGSTGCTRAELAALLRMLEATGVRPLIHRVIALREIHAGLQAMIDGDVVGKIVVRVSGAPDNKASYSD